jgi:hypothetical protein
MTLMGKMRRGSKRQKWLGSQIPGDSACKTGAVGAARRSHGFSMASMWHPSDNHVCGAVAISAGAKKTEKHRKTKNTGRNRDNSQEKNGISYLSRYLPWCGWKVSCKRKK